MELVMKNKKITTIGGSLGFIVDKAYFKNENIDKDQEYDIVITPSKKIRLLTDGAVTPKEDQDE